MVKRWRLRFILQEIDLPHGRTTLGRDADCPITFEDALVSRHHAEIHVSDEGCMVIDLGSRNGVWVNGRRVTAPAILQSNDRIRLGRDELVVLQETVDDATRGERETGSKHVCVLCGHEHVADLDVCPSCGVLRSAGVAIAEFLAFADGVPSSR